MKRWLSLILLLLASSAAEARVDTLRGTTEIDDATIYNYLGCDPEVFGENCRRYNSGGGAELRVGTVNVDDHRVVMRFPGWNGELPDSSTLEIYCEEAEDEESRRIFVYPLTRRFWEGSEGTSNVGGYPEPDSGVTWNHVRLDVGDLDSLLWTTPGGDYSTGVACTVMVAGVGQYRVRSFNRMLTWWRSMSTDPGIVLINQNAFPGNSAMKRLTSSEGELSLAPRLLLYYADEPVEWNGRRLKMLTGSRE